MPRSPKGRAVARGLDAHLHLQHAFMPAGYASLKIAQVNQKCRLTVITVSTATRSGYWLGYHRVGDRLRNVDGFRAGLMSTNHVRPS
jgi:hypothetical protein